MIGAQRALTRYDDPRVLSPGAAAMDPTPDDNDADEVPPWEEPGAVRRDCEPHRAGVLWYMAMTSLTCAMFGCCTYGIAGIAAVALAVTVLILAGRDLVEMAAGRMDPDGEPDTRSSRRISLLAMFICVWLWVLLAASLLPDPSVGRRMAGGSVVLGLVLLVVRARFFPWWP